MAIAAEDNQLKFAIAEGDNETKERIEAARLTRDKAKMQVEQRNTALTTLNQGNQNGYQ